MFVVILKEIVGVILGLNNDTVSIMTEAEEGDIYHSAVIVCLCLSSDNQTLLIF